MVLLKVKFQHPEKESDVVLLQLINFIILFKFFSLRAPISRVVLYCSKHVKGKWSYVFRLI